MFRRIKISLYLLILVCSCPAFAQEDPLNHWGQYAMFHEDFRLDSTHDNGLYIRINNANYFKNNEYKNDFIRGRSLIGMFFEPSLDFYIASNTRIRAGAHFLKFHGTDGFDRATPIISIQHRVNPHFDITFGTIRGTSNHGLLEPILGFEKYLTDHYENGLQFLFSYPNFHADFWLNWEQFIQAGDPFQEHFTAGGHMHFPLINSEKWKLNADMQMIFQHKGGEIDATDLPAGTQNNLSQGLEFTRNISGSFFKEFSLSHHFVGFFEINPGGHIDITEGYGQYSMAGLTTGLGYFGFGYWTASNYLSPHGEPLFLSQSVKDPEIFLKDRRMLTIKYQLHKKLTSYLDIAFRFEPYYHFYTGRMDHSWSIYLLLDKDFFIARFGSGEEKKLPANR